MRKAMLGEEGTEQFIIISKVDGEVIKEQPIHDPFVHSTVIVMRSRWDLFKALFQKQFEIRVEVSVQGSQGAQRAIMTLDPEALARDTAEFLEQQRISRENSPTIGYYSYEGSVSGGKPNYR